MASEMIDSKPIETVLDDSTAIEEAAAKTFQAYLDRIEEVEEGADKAVLYIGDDTDDMIKIVLPVTLLPDDACEGDYVTITIAIDNAEDDLAAANEE